MGNENTGKWETEKNYVDKDKPAKDAEYEKGKFESDTQTQINHFSKRE